MNKIGLHISGPNGSRNGLGNWLLKLDDAGCPAPVLYSVNVDLADDARRLSPSTRWIYRRQSSAFERLPGTMWQGNAEASARLWLTQTKDKSDRGRVLIENWSLNRADWHDPLNEPVPGNINQAKWLNDWMCEAITIGAQHGYRLALFSFATGSPQYHLWPEFIDALQLGKQHGAILSLHAYNDGGLCERSSGVITDATLHNALRHWQIYKYLPEAAHLPVVYTEASMGNGYGMQPQGKWIDDLIAYAKIVEDDKDLLGFCAYQCGGSESNCYRALPALSKAIVAEHWT